MLCFSGYCSLVLLSTFLPVFVVVVIGVLWFSLVVGTFVLFFLGLVEQIFLGVA